MIGNLAVNGTVTVNIADALPQLGPIPLVQYGSRSGSGSFVLGSLPAGEAETKLLVLMGGGDVFVSVGFDPDSDPDHDRCHHRQSLGGRGHPLDLFEGVDHDPADSMA